VHAASAVCLTFAGLLEVDGYAVTRLAKAFLHSYSPRPAMNNPQIGLGMTDSAEPLIKKRTQP
jgi:hypothetical protein